jgi:hypothetical protein
MTSDARSDLTCPEVCTDLVRTLLEIGYVAVGRGLQSHAEDIFHGLIAARPESELPIIGLAVCKMNFGDFASATKLLSEDAIRINPASSMAKCFLGVVSHYCGAKNETLAIMNEVVESGNDESAVNIAKSVLEEINSKK